MKFKDLFQKSNQQLSGFLHKAGNITSDIFHKVGRGIQTVAPIVGNLANNPAVQMGVAGLASAVGGPEAGIASQKFLSNVGSLAGKAQKVGQFSTSLGDFTNPSNYTGNTAQNATNVLERAKALNNQKQVMFA